MAHLHLSPGDETLWAVVVGAVLATVSGFLATQLEGLIRRRERERGAALLFGEILSVLELFTVMASEVRERGERYGLFTMRILRAVQREIEIYDRNREALYDLRQAKVRGQIHALMVRVSLSLEGVAETTDRIAAAETTLRGLAEDHPDRPVLQARLEDMISSRESAFEFAVETAGRAPPILALLRPLAKQDFGVYAQVVRNPEG